MRQTSLMSYFLGLVKGNNLTQEQREQAAEKLRMQHLALSTQGHMPGKIHAHSDGIRYKVQPSGSWVKF